MTGQKVESNPQYASNFRPIALPTSGRTERYGRLAVLKDKGGYMASRSVW